MQRLFFVYVVELDHGTTTEVNIPQKQEIKQNSNKIQILILSPALSPLDGGVAMTITCRGLDPDKEIELRIDGHRCACAIIPEESSIQFVSPPLNNTGRKKLEIIHGKSRAVLEDVLTYVEFNNEQSNQDIHSSRKKWGKK